MKTANFAIGLFSAVFCLLIFIKIFLAAGKVRAYEIENLILHLGAPFLAILLVTRRRDLASQLMREMIAAQTTDNEEAKPKPLNTSVEKLSWADLVIDDNVKWELQSVVELLKDPKSAKKYGIGVPKGILLSGPPGTGKTTIAKVLASQSGCSFFALKTNEIISKWVGESEKNLSALFDAAAKHRPAIIFIDEIDAVAKARSSDNAAHTDSFVNHLLQLMDGVVKSEGIYIVAATNRPDLVDEALKRPGRLNKTIEIGLPDFNQRVSLLRLGLGKLNLNSDVDIETLAQTLDGASPAQIIELCNQAGLNAFKRESALGKNARSYTISLSDLEAALAELQNFLKEASTTSRKGANSNKFSPSSVNAQVEQISFDSLILPAEVKTELISLINILKDAESARGYGIDPPKGILLYGPPGTGKTSIAKAVANQAGLSFFALRIDEVISQWVGESEKNLTALFAAAEKNAPAVIFIDEIDSIAKNRAQGNAQHADNLLNHLLQLMDGVIKKEGIFIIGATNRPELVDPAMKRGGRLDKGIYIGLPDLAARQDLFKLYLGKLKLEGSLNYETLAKITEGVSPADIKQICNQAGVNAFKRESKEGNQRSYVVKGEDLKQSLSEFINLRRERQA
ncbi:MAG TPA: AAA family ATPase [Oligoflexia bacterium]|nr:AAA family ATPase [Oligoflexia bacterium]